jgi:hypothetical protein
VIRDCIRPRNLRLIAFDAAGRRIDRARVFRAPGLCDSPVPPPVPATGRWAFELERSAR